MGRWYGYSRCGGSIAWGRRRLDGFRDLENGAAALLAGKRGPVEENTNRLLVYFY